MRHDPSNDFDDDFMVEITSLDTPETPVHAHDEVLQGARVAPRVRILLTILSGVGAILLIVLVLSTVLSPLWPKPTTTPPQFHPPVQVQNVMVQGDIAYVTSSDETGRVFRVKDGSLLWQRKLPNVTPVFVKNTMYIYYYDQQYYMVQALNASSGKLLWTFKTSSSTFFPLVIDNGVTTVLSNGPLSSEEQGYSKVQAQGQTLIALDGRTGAELWQYNTHISLPLNVYVQAMQDKIYISTWSDYQMRHIGLWVLKSGDGVLLWHYDKPDLRQTNAASASQPYVIPPHTPGGLVYLIIGDGSLNAIDANNGREVWHYKPANHNDAAPAPGANHFYIQTIEGPIKALRADNGTLAWSYNDPTGITSIFPEINGILYIKTSDGFIVALRVSDGKRLWRVQPIVPPFTAGSIQVEGSIAYATALVGTGTNSTIAALRVSDGVLLWQRKMEIANGMDPSLMNGGQLFINAGSTITALRGRDGVVLWHADHVEPDFQYGWPLTIVGNVALLCLSGGALEAHQGATGAVLWRYPHGTL